MAARKPRRQEAKDENDDLSFRKRRQGTCPELTPEQLREQGLEEEKKKYLSRQSKVALKLQAGEMTVGGARMLQNSLRDLLERYPGHFHAFRAVIEGRGEEITDEHRRDLKRWHFVESDDSPNPNFKAVMAAAYRQTPDGPAIVDAVELGTPDEVAAMRDFDEKTQIRSRRNLARLLGRLLDDNNDRGQDRSS